MIKIIWSLIGLNTIGLIYFIGAYFVLNQGKNVDYQEKGWTFILAAIGLLIILLAAIPLHFSQTTFVQIFSGFFAALPLVIALGIFISNNLPSWKQKPTFATTYYKDKTQRTIATAIQNGDTTLLRELIKGEDLNIQGEKVWDIDGLNYLQFAIRVRSNPFNFPFNEEANMAAIRILIENGSATTPAFAEATKYLSYEELSLFLDAGANPNCNGFGKPYPLLFDVIGSQEKDNDMFIFLLKNGADVNAKNDINWTPVMHAAHNASTRTTWTETWRLVRYMLEEAHADYTHTTAKGVNLGFIIKEIRVDADAKSMTMPEDFYKVVEWLKQHDVDTEPATEKHS